MIISRAFVLHILILIIVTSKVVFLLFVDANFMLLTSALFRYLFTNNIETQGKTAFDDDFQVVYANNQVISNVEFVLNQYKNMQNTSVSLIKYRNTPHKYINRIHNNNLMNDVNDFEIVCEDVASPIDLIVNKIEGNHVNSLNLQINNIDELSQFNVSLNSFPSQVLQFEIAMHFCVYRDNYYNYDKGSNCFAWDVNIVYKYVAQMIVTIETQTNLIGSCSNRIEGTKSTTFWFEIVILILSIPYAGLVIKAISVYVTRYFRVRDTHAEARRQFLLLSEEEQVKYAGPDAVRYSWAQIPLATKRRLHCDWVVITLIALVLLILNAGYRLNYAGMYTFWQSFDKITLGFACLLLWSSVLQFAQSDRSLYAVVLTISTGIPRMLAYFIGVIPLFLAVSFLSITVFCTKLGIFATFTVASYSLFSMLLCDSLRQFMLLLNLARGSVVSILATFCLIFVFTYLIFNIMIAITEHSYFSSRVRRRYLEVLIERGMRDVQSPNSTLPSDLNKPDDHKQSTVTRDSFHSQHELEDSFGDEGFAAVRGDLSGLLDAIDESLIENNRRKPATADNISHPGNNEGTSVNNTQTPQLRLTLEEKDAELHIFGENHWDYSKMIDYLAECYYRDYGQQR